MDEFYCIAMHDEYPNDIIKIPKIQTSNSAAYDLYANTDGEVLPLSKTLIKTKVRVKIPNNYCGQIWSRSSLSLKNGIETGAGVIDSDYQGELGVILYNNTDEKFVFTKEMRIAQMIVVPIFNKPIIQCSDGNEFLSKFSSNERGDGGFGSTGV